MPQKRKSQEAELKNLISACQQKVEDIWNNTVSNVLSGRGYTLHRYMFGELDEGVSQKVILGVATLDEELLPDDLEKMESGVPDIVVKDSSGKVVVCIETMSATIETNDKSIESEIDQFAQEWEDDRSSHMLQLKKTLKNLGIWPDGFSKTVTVIEV